MNGVFHVVGGYKEHYTQFSNILAWDAVAETWQVVGHLANARSNQAVMEVTLDLYDFCVHTTATFDYSIVTQMMIQKNT